MLSDNNLKTSNLNYMLQEKALKISVVDHGQLLVSYISNQINYDTIEKIIKMQFIPGKIKCNIHKMMIGDKGDTFQLKQWMLSLFLTMHFNLEQILLR